MRHGMGMNNVKSVVGGSMASDMERGRTVAEGSTSLEAYDGVLEEWQW